MTANAACEPLAGGPMKWFRFYSEVLHDPKVQRLSAEQFRFWVNVLCLANDGKPRGALPPVADAAFVLRMKAEKAERLMAALVDAGLVDRAGDGTLAPHNWAARQHKGDNSLDRVQKYRDQIRANGETVTGYTKHRAAVLARDGGACVYCGATAKLVLDHLIPVNRGGRGEPDNLVTACKACNSGKAGRLVEEAGYVFANPAAAALYLAARSRLVTVTGGSDGGSPVTPVTVTVTPRVRADSDSDSETECVCGDAGASPGDSEPLRREADVPPPPAGSKVRGPGRESDEADELGERTKSLGVDHRHESYAYWAVSACDYAPAAWVDAILRQHVAGRGGMARKPVAVLNRILGDCLTEGRCSLLDTPPARASPVAGPDDVKAAALAMKARHMAKEASRG